MSLKKLENLIVKLLWGLSLLVIVGWIATHDDIRIRRDLSSALASWTK